MPGHLRWPLIRLKRYILMIIINKKGTPKLFAPRVIRGRGLWLGTEQKCLVRFLFS
jgi:hypothetical protein